MALLNEFVYDYRGNNTYFQEKTALSGCPTQVFDNSQVGSFKSMQIVKIKTFPVLLKFELEVNRTREKP